MQATGLYRFCTQRITRESLLLLSREFLPSRSSQLDNLLQYQSQPIHRFARETKMLERILY